MSKKDQSKEPGLQFDGELVSSAAAVFEPAEENTLTAAEAGLKWCPKSAGSTGSDFNCLAGGCAWWRWDSAGNERRSTAWAEDNQPVDQGGPGATGGEPPADRGFCGGAANFASRRHE